MVKSKKQDFSYWYEHEFLCSRDPLSPVIFSENRAAIAKYKRIGEIAKIIAEEPKYDVQELRETIAIRYLISMRIALDYVRLAELVVKEYNKRQTLNS